MSGAATFHRRPSCFIPCKCRALIERGVLVALNPSGGTESQAMTILLSRLVPRDRRLAVHAPSGHLALLCSRK